jgi:flagellar protein FliS
MYQNPYGSSLEAKVMSATPQELIEMLFDAAVKAVSDARVHLAAGRIHDRAAKVSQAVAILTELGRSLDHKHDVELSGRLAALYDYIGRRLIDANFEQSDDGLAEAETLLRTVREGWVRGMASLVPAASVHAVASSAARQWSA